MVEVRYEVPHQTIGLFLAPSLNKVAICFNSQSDHIIFLLLFNFYTLLWMKDLFVHLFIHPSPRCIYLFILTNTMCYLIFLFDKTRCYFYQVWAF